MNNLIELNGKYTDAKMFINTVDEGTIGQVTTMINEPVTDGGIVRIMPDAHYGKGSTVGTTIHYPNGINRVVPSIVGVDVGCLDAETEVLTTYGWIPMSEYKTKYNDRNLKVLTFEPKTGEAFFEVPIAYIKKPCDTFYHFKNSKGLDQKLSKEHNILLYKGYKAKGYTTEFLHPEDLLAKKLEKGYYSFNTAFDLVGGGLDFTDVEIQLMVMVSADGTVRSRVDGSSKYELHFSKERKVNRAIYLLEKAGIEYKHTKSEKTGTHYIYFHTETFLNKDLSQFYFASKHQLEVLYKESFSWDGHVNKKDQLYYTTSIKNASVIQFAMASNGIRGSIYTTTYNKDNWRDVYCVRATKNSKVCYTDTAEKVSSTDGYSYCFTTSTGAFVARRNNKIFVTGNCGIMVAQIEKPEDTTDTEWAKLDAVINKVVPSGFNIRETLDELHPNVPNTIKHMLESMTFKGATEEPFINHITLSLGTLGGGNHFIELSKDDEDNYYLLVHTGSRSLGLAVAMYHQKKADKYHKQDTKGLVNMIERLKQEGRQTEIQEAVKNFKAVNVKPQLPYLEGSAVDDYLNDMQLAQRYAYMNRKTIIDKIVSNMGWTVVDLFDSIHNYIDVDSSTIRKGATDAQEGVRLVIPLNMKEGSIIGVGKGNTDWNNSAPHGAGRVLSRSKAKELLDLDEFKQTMSGIYTTSVVQSTLDEAPKAYKNADEIKEIIKDTVDIQKIVKPVYNFKAK